MRNGSILVVLWLGGCDLEVAPLAPLSPDFEQDLTEVGGCGDVFAYAVDAGDEVMLTVHLDGPIAASENEPVTLELTLPDPSAEVKVERGSQISDAICDDVIENGGPRVDETWTAVSGTVTADVEVGEHTTLTDVTLEDVVFENEAGEEVTVETFEWTEISVGWLPG